MKEIIWIVIHVPFNILILRYKIYNQYVSLMLVIMHIDTPTFKSSMTKLEAHVFDNSIEYYNKSQNKQTIFSLIRIHSHSSIMSSITSFTTWYMVINFE